MGPTPGVRDTVEGSTEFAVDAGRLWEALDSPERLQALLPGVRDFELGAADDGSFVATFEPQTSFGPVPVATRWLRTRHEPPAQLAYSVSGRSGENLVELRVALELQPAAEGRVAVAWTCKATATGTLRSVTQRVLAGVLADHVQRILAAAAREATSPVQP